jgi:proline dehydrogenase
MSLLRNALLAGSTNPWLREHAMRTAFVRKSVARFMPGERIEDAIRAAAELKPQGITTILTKLGENLESAAEFEDVTRHYLEVLDRIGAAGLDAHISVKPTQLGLDLDPALCERNLARLVAHAEERGTFVWIDMESSGYVDRTIALFRRMRARTPRVGIALQAYLYRTEKDVEALVPLGAAIRIVKGAYLEPPEVAFPQKADVDRNFFKLCARLLAPDARQPGALLHIATHDIPLAERLAAHIARENVPGSAYEFAMLYGIQRGQQARLAAAGTRLRVLISYGEYWFPWYMRRLAERPANMWFVVRTMFG